MRVLAVGLRLGVWFERDPERHTVLKLVGAACLLVRAWRIATAGRRAADIGPGRPLTFLDAALFQVVNPTGGVFAVTVVALCGRARGGRAHDRARGVPAGVHWLDDHLDRLRRRAQSVPARVADAAAHVQLRPGSPASCGRSAWCGRDRARGAETLTGRLASAGARPRAATSGHAAEGAWAQNRRRRPPPTCRPPAVTASDPPPSGCVRSMMARLNRTSAPTPTAGVR